MTKMKVLQINAVYKFSSTGRTTLEFHDYLKSLGIASAIAAVDVPCENDEYIKLAGRFSLVLHAVLSRITGRQGHFSYFSTKKLVRKIRNFNPDIIHLRILHSNCINLPVLLGFIAQKDIPTVITLHDCWYFTGHCCYFVDSGCDRWRSGCGQCPDLKNWNRSLFFDFSARNLEDKKRLFSKIKRLAVVGVSDWVTNFVYDSILKESRIITRIYNWIDVEKFKPLETKGLRDKLGVVDDFVVLCCAQIWGREKGIFDVIEVANSCLNFKFVLVGKVSDEYLPLPPNIIQVGVLSDVGKLVEYYSMADCFFSPSIRETFGKVTVEAMSCGTPVVAYNLTATPELVKDGCGYLTEPHNIQSVVNCLGIIHKEGKAKFSNRCREIAIERFSCQVVMKQYVDLYKELVCL